MYATCAKIVKEEKKAGNVFMLRPMTIFANILQGVDHVLKLP